jgi:hypothetical protein
VREHFGAWFRVHTPTRKCCATFPPPQRQCARCRVDELFPIPIAAVGGLVRGSRSTVPRDHELLEPGDHLLVVLRRLIEVLAGKAASGIMTVILPDLQIYNLIDAIVEGKVLKALDLLKVTGITAFYCVTYLFASWLVFARKEF